MSMNVLNADRQRRIKAVWDGLSKTERRVATVLQQTGPLEKHVLAVVHLSELEAQEIDNALVSLIQKNVVNIAPLDGCCDNKLHLDPDFQRSFSS